MILILVTGIVAGAIVVYLVLKPRQPAIATIAPAEYKVARTYQNEETWDMWEDEQGHIHTVIHRKVNG